MKKRISIVVSLLILSFVNTAYALLEDNGDGTITQIRNDGSTLMWLQDANYSQTSGYDSDGLMTWYEANDWIAALNSSNYLAYNDWRLPITLPVNGADYNYNFSVDGSTDYGYNTDSLNSEMGYMFYIELGNLGVYDKNGQSRTNFGLTNTGLFDNLQPTEAYWSGTENASDTYRAWSFGFTSGNQDHIFGKDNWNFQAWAVRNVAVIPEPISSILFIIGGATLGFRFFIQRKFTSKGLDRFSRTPREV